MAAIPPRWLTEERLSRALAAPDPPPAGPPRRAAFHPLRVAAVEHLTADSIAVTFDVPEELADAYRFTAGQHLTIRSDHGGIGVRRSYSIASPAPDGPLRIGVKRLPGGAFSSWAVESLGPGDVLDVMTPAGTFGVEAEPERARHHVAVAVGSGITPVLSVLATVLAEEPDSRATLLFGNRTTADVMFLEDLEDLKNRHAARFQVLHTLSREPQEVPLRAGRLDAAKLASILDALVPTDDVDAWFLCGPQALVEEWRAVLLARDVAPEAIHRELFHAGPGPAYVPGGAGAPADVPVGGVHRVAFTLDGRSSEVLVTAGEAVLDGVLRVRADAPFACRGGVCGTCRARLTAGEVAMTENYALEADELGAGYVLTCQARPLTEAVTVDYDV
jgi:ring-1,2-phenylacetyl-CoA epoxidase subunit PaaE